MFFLFKISGIEVFKKPCNTNTPGDSLPAELSRSIFRIKSWFSFSFSMLLIRKTESKPWKNTKTNSNTTTLQLLILIRKHGRED